MYAVALAGLRLAPRRTLSQWTAIDVAAAVALGDVRYVLYESKGELTIVPERGPQEPDPDPSSGSP
jgi:hypothetical protein